MDNKKGKYFLIVLYMVAFILVWDLCDFVAATFITKKGFHFEVVPNLIQPVFTGVIVGLLIFFTPKMRRK